MADNPTTNPSGQLQSVQLRATDTGSGEAFHGKSAPWIATGVTGKQVLSVSSSVVTLTVPTGATHAFISVEGAAIRFYNTGDTPSSTDGHLLAAGAGPLEVDRLANVKLIRQTADATVQVSYHKYV